MTNPQRAVADLQGFPLERTMGTHDTWLGKAVPMVATPDDARQLTTR
jgi:hypothetical protein